MTGPRKKALHKHLEQMRTEIRQDTTLASEMGKPRTPTVSTGLWGFMRMIHIDGCSRGADRND